MKRILLIVLCAVAGPALAQKSPADSAPLPTDPALRAVACTVIMGAMGGTIRSSSADMAAELDTLSRRWRARAISLYQAKGQGSEAEQQISLQGMALTSGAGLPAGTFDKAAICQSEGAGLPGT